MNKAQMEIFGLVIIVILLALGLLFTIIILTKNPTTETQHVKSSIQAANFLNTIMSTTAQDCNKRSVRELLQTCALSETTCEDGSTTCALAEKIISTMLQRTFGKLNKDYEFKITGTPTLSQIHIKNGPCTGEKESSTRPEKIRPGLDMTVSLSICASD